MSQLHPLVSAVEHPSPAKHRLTPWRAIAGIALAPVAFVLQVTASYVVAALSCSTSHSPPNWLIGINVLALGMTVAGMVIAANNFQSTREEKDGDQRQLQEVGEGRSRFLAYCGICTSAMFGLGVIIQLLAIVMVSACVGFASFN